MATVDKTFADKIVAGNGYPTDDTDNSMGDNPRVTLIIEYTNMAGGQAFGILFEGQRNKYTESEYVRAPKQYWAYTFN